MDRRYGFGVSRSRIDAGGEGKWVVQEHGIPADETTAFSKDYGIFESCLGRLNRVVV